MHKKEKISNIACAGTATVPAMFTMSKKYDKSEASLSLAGCDHVALFSLGLFLTGFG